VDYEPVTREEWVCRVCRRPLDIYQAHEDGAVVEFRWLHPGVDRPVDHEPDPVRLADSGGEMVSSCDFCTGPAPGWRYPARDFGTEPWGSVGDWSACDACHDLIEAGLWAKVTYRALKSYPSRQREQLRPHVEALHAEFRRHRSGDPTRL
jgi:hypothetical protein